MSDLPKRTGSLRKPLDLMHLISGVNRQLEQQVGARLKPAGVPIEQYRILEALTERNGRAMGELAGLVFVDSPTLTKIIDRMVAKAEVYRAPDPNDRRKVLIFISDKGADTLKHLRELLAEPENQLASRLEASDADQLCSLLENLLEED